MEKDEAQMTQSESLQLIASMINKAKNRFSESGTLYLLWGWLILICCIVQFISLHFFDTDASYIWFSTWLLLIYQFFFLRKRIKARNVRTYTEEINGFVWVTFFICLILVNYVAVQFRRYELIAPMLLILYGMPTFLSGIILKFKPLIVGGICCWLLALISPFINVNYQLLLSSAAVISAWIIPGYLLKQKFRKGNEI
ncbi:MAG: hypothetical protein M3Z26_13750 [Bacteroidota bacterium]|nr:hypothetical protein [Bacteroidota bacterium]